MGRIAASFRLKKGACLSPFTTAALQSLQERERERERERDCFFEESTAVPSQGADAVLLVPSALNVNVVSLNQAGVNSGSDCDSPKAANCLVI